MDANILPPLKRNVLGLFCLLLLVQSLLAIPSTSHHSGTDTGRNSRHSRVSRAIKSRDHPAAKSTYQPGRQTKFSYLGPAGIRSNDNATAKIHGVWIGLIPDAGDTGGKAQTMHEIIKSINGKRPAVFGWYAQVVAGTPFDGSQLFEVLDDLKASKAVFSPAIMPQGGWDGFKYNDNSQAVRIAKVLRKITDQDIPVIFRWAHEANWYQRTHQYHGNAEDFKEAWSVVASAVRKHAPDVLLHWCPNVSDMKEYHKYEPYDMDGQVDLVGFDYYPNSKPEKGEFVKKAQDFHDKYAINGRKFAMGEAGLHYQGTYEDRVEWLSQMAHAKDQLPNLLFINWYNSKKEYDYKIAGDGISTNLLTEKLE